MPKRVYRRCPACGDVSRASELVRLPAEGDGPGGTEPAQPGAQS